MRVKNEEEIFSTLHNFSIMIIELWLERKRQRRDYNNFIFYFNFWLDYS